MTDRSHHIDFDELMRSLTVVGFVALTAWILASSVGVISGYVAVSSPATLRFLLAVLVVVFARRTYWEIREWRWGKLSPDERSGFTSPLVPNPLASGAWLDEEPSVRDPFLAAETAATGSQQPRA